MCDDPATSGLTWGVAAAAPGFDRLAASFHGVAYDRHRHDTYGLAMTMRGVQTFWYRGTEHHSLPGQVVILHPDEPHTGGAGTDDGLEYRMLYLDPALLSDAAGGPAPLPFVRDPVVSDPSLWRILHAVLAELAVAPDALLVDSAIAALAAWMHDLAGAPDQSARRSIDYRALDRVREYLVAHALEPVTMTDLAEVAGIDRYQLARGFRQRFGTSPYHFLLNRRVDHARRLIEAGQPLAGVAATTGFADQSHLTRQFKRAYGFPPGVWRDLTRQANAFR